MLTPELCTMSKVRRSFTREFKVEAVKLVTESRNPVAQVARELGLRPNLLRRWKQALASNPADSFPGKGRRKPTLKNGKRLYAASYGRKAWRLVVSKVC
jgi:transposase